MKAFFYTWFILGLLFSSSLLQAQVGGEGRTQSGSGYWILGLNAGGAWQDSDVRALPGGGWGFYFGHSINYRPQTFFTADWRFRYLNTYTYGQNTLDTQFGNPNLTDRNVFGYRPDSLAFAHNHETIFHDLSLELRVNFEELRRKSNVWLSLYAGVGLGIYGTRFDQKNFNWEDYDYESVNYNQSDAAIVDDLVTLRDGEYETNAFGDGFDSDEFRVTLTPSIGIELGYWFSPRFALGIGHRTTFTLQDDFEGVRLSNDGAINSAIHHYTSLMFHWRFPTKTREVACPKVQFQLPTTNGEVYRTTESSVFIQAEVENVRQDQITYTVNGQTVNNFTYNSIESTFQMNQSLVEGENLIVVQANNSCGTDGQNVTVIYTPEQIPMNPPVITVNSPANNTTFNQCLTSVNARILEVDDRSQVSFTLNGTPVNSFSFSNSMFQANNLNLIEGQNILTIQASNGVGTDIETVTVFCQPAVDPAPIVTFTNPINSPQNTSNPTAQITANIQHVPTRSNVIYTVNGQVRTDFNFSGTSFSSSINLQPGTNTISITGSNNVGQDSKTTVIIYQEVIQPPVVNITYPNPSPFNTDVANTRVTATILNVPNRSDVSCTVNGQLFNNFTYNGSFFNLANLNLQQGTNTVTITGRNNAGQDSKTVTIIYNPRVTELPPVVTINYPTASPFTTASPSSQVTATIANVNDRSGVSCTVNGQLVNSFSFAGNYFNLSSLNLVQGNNTITITGRNSAGQDSKSTIIIYRPVVQKPAPIVTITSPTANPFVTSNSRVNIQANIQHVTSRNDVTFTYNGQIYTSFNFSGTNFSANNISLQTGNNTFVITGRNSSGQDTKSTLVIYNPPLPAPTVVITTPKKNPFTTTSATTNIQASLTNVASKNDITFTINGQIVSNYSYSNGTLVANNVNLTPGGNVVSITGRNGNGQATATTTIIYEAMQPPVVTITVPNQNPANTVASTASVMATVTNVPNRSGITVTINGQAATKFAYVNGLVSLNNFNLNQGNNTVVITGRNNAGQDSKSTVIIYSKPVLEPAVTITSPTPNFTTNVNKVNVRATILNVPSKNNVQFKVNGQTVTNFTLNGTAFSADNVVLNAGNNTIQISGSNSAGTATASTNVIFQKPQPKPVVTITVPNQNPANTTSATATVNATVLHVANSSGITVTINGQSITKFSYSNNLLTIKGFSLNQGANTITITGRNNAGQDSKSTVIIYSKPVLEPAVTITTPAVNPFNTTSNKVNIRATILNVPSASNVQFKLNGQAVSKFNFNGTGFSVDNVNLKEGSNTIQISGSNSAGTATASTVVIYTKPVAKPVVRITIPNQNPANTTAATASVTASVTNVPTSSGISVNINGQSVKKFGYANGLVTVNNFNLNQGANTITITGRNSAGQDSKSTVIIYSKPVLEPAVTITSPTPNFTTSNSKVNVRATILNVPSRNNVQFKVNGQVISKFTFNGTAFSIDNVNLNPGSNTIQISGSNSTGTATASTTVIYNKPVLEPAVTITSPAPNFTTTTNKVNVRATILNVPSKNNVQFKVNGQTITNFSLNGNAFAANDVVLNAGNNNIQISGSNSAGTATASTVVIFKKPVPKPVVTITQPTPNPYNVTTNKVNVRATILNVPSKNNVQFKVNGQNITNFSLTGNNFAANNVILNAGSNTIMITGSNSSGTATASTVVIFSKPVQEPVVTITQPTPNFTTSTNKVNVRATILNVPSKNNVQFKVNGQNISNFSLNGNNFAANDVVLNQGANTIQISGSNSTGTATASTTVTYTPIAKPTIRMISPGITPWNAPSNKVDARATIIGVSSKNDLTFKVNGVVNTNFTLTGTTFSATNIGLINGNNTFQIIARNAGGQTIINRVIVYTPTSNKPAPNTNNQKAPDGKTGTPTSKPEQKGKTDQRSRGTERPKPSSPNRSDSGSGRG